MNLPPLPPLPALPRLLTPEVDALPMMRNLPLPFEPELSPILPMDVQPVRAGYYELMGKRADGGYFPLAGLHTWTGFSWTYDDQALKPAGWRGLAADPAL